MLAMLLLFAQGGEGAPKGAPMGMELLIIPALLLLFYFMVIRPAQRRQEQEAAEKVNSLQKDDEILTIGGIYGTVSAIAADKDEITVKIADNTRVRMSKAAIHRNITNEERLKAKADAPKDAKAEGTTTTGQIRKA